MWAWFQPWNLTCDDILDSHYFCKFDSCPYIEPRFARCVECTECWCADCRPSVDMEMDKALRLFGDAPPEGRPLACPGGIIQPQFDSDGKKLVPRVIAGAFVFEYDAHTGGVGGCQIGYVAVIN